MENKIKKIDNFLNDYRPQITEIRKILIRSLLAFLIGGTLGLIFNRKIILFVMSRFNLDKVNIVLTSPTQFINLAFRIAIVFGLMATIPVFLFYLLRYVRPALKKKEYSLIIKVIPASVFLFIFGSLFGGWIEQFIVTMYSQTTVDFSLNNVWDIEMFLSQFLIMSFIMGLVFELPVVLTILIRFKVITTKILAQQRRYVYAALVVLAILLPPTDIVSLSLITVPLLILFEFTLLLNREI